MEPEARIKDEDLIAFLDGELPDDQAAAIQSNITSDAKLQARVKELQTSWDLLDELPVERAKEDLVVTTLELIALDFKGDELRRARSVQAKAHWLAGLSAIVASALLGLLFSNYLSYREENRLLADLPLLTHFPQLQHIDTPEFLEQLATLDGLAAVASKKLQANPFRSIPPQLEDRPDWLDSLPSEQQAIVIENLKQFSAVTPQRQKQLRQMAAAIEPDAPTCEKTLAAIEAYSILLSRIGTSEQAQLNSFESIEQRMEVLKKIVQREIAFAYAHRMANEDREAIRAWTTDLQEEIFRQMTRQSQEVELKLADDSFERSERFQDNFLKYFAGFESAGEQIGYLLVNEDSDTYVTQEDLKRLISRLTPYAQSLLANLDDRWQRDTISVWTLFAVDKSPSSETTTDDLRRRFDELTAERQAAIELLPEREARRVLAP